MLLQTECFFQCHVDSSGEDCDDDNDTDYKSESGSSDVSDVSTDEFFEEVKNTKVLKTPKALKKKFQLQSTSKRKVSKIDHLKTQEAAPFDYEEDNVTEETGEKRKYNIENVFFYIYL